MNANTRQVGGDHYRIGKFQHWDHAVQVMDNRYLEAQVTRYLCRDKGGDAGYKVDLGKSVHILEKLLEEAKEGRVRPTGDADTRLLDNRAKKTELFCEAYGIPELTGFVDSLSNWSCVADLERLLVFLQSYVTDAVQKMTP